MITKLFNFHKKANFKKKKENYNKPFDNRRDWWWWSLRQQPISCRKLLDSTHLAWDRTQRRRFGWSRKRDDSTTRGSIRLADSVP